MSDSRNKEEYNKNAAFVANYGLDVLDILDVQDGEYIADIGCGDGVHIKKMIEKGAKVLGIDDAAKFIKQLEQEGIPVLLCDAKYLPFEGVFDAVFTNATLHRVGSIELTLAGIHKSLKQGGRFVGEFGAHGNVATVHQAIRDVLGEHHIIADNLHQRHFPTKKAFEDQLRLHGFTDIQVHVFPRPTPLPTGIKGWITQFGFPFFKIFDESKKTSLIEQVEHRCHQTLRDEQSNQYIADYVRIRFSAIKA